MQDLNCHFFTDTLKYISILVKVIFTMEFRLIILSKISENHFNQYCLQE